MTDAQKIAELEERVRSMQWAIKEMAQTAETVCGRLIPYRLVVDAARELVRAYEHGEDAAGAIASERLMMAVHALPAELSA